MRRIPPSPLAESGNYGWAWSAMTGSLWPSTNFLSDGWKRDCMRTRVVVDIISGTSAGEINGFLAKAIRHKRTHPLSLPALVRRGELRPARLVENSHARILEGWEFVRALA